MVVGGFAAEALNPPKTPVLVVGCNPVKVVPPPIPNPPNAVEVGWVCVPKPVNNDGVVVVVAVVENNPPPKVLPPNVGAGLLPKSPVVEAVVVAPNVVVVPNSDGADVCVPKSPDVCVVPKRLGA